MHTSPRSTLSSPGLFGSTEIVGLSDATTRREPKLARSLLALVARPCKAEKKEREWLVARGRGCSVSDAGWLLIAAWLWLLQCRE